MNEVAFQWFECLSWIHDPQVRKMYQIISILLPKKGQSTDGIYNLCGHPPKHVGPSLCGSPTSTGANLTRTCNKMSTATRTGVEVIRAEIRQSKSSEDIGA